MMQDKAQSHVLRDYRRLTGITLAELAGELGTSKTTLSEIENGKREVSLELLPRLVAATRIPAGKFRPDLERLLIDGEVAA